MSDIVPASASLTATNGVEEAQKLKDELAKKTGELEAMKLKSPLPRMSAAGTPTKAVNFDGLSEEERALVDKWDEDRDGTLSVAEVLRLAKAERRMQQKYASLKKVVVLLVLFSMFMMGCVAAMSYISIELAKDTHTPADGKMNSASGKPVTVGSRKQTLGLLEIFGARDHSMLHLDKVYFPATSGDEFWLSVGHVGRLPGGVVTLRGAGNYQVSIQSQTAQLTTPEGERFDLRTHDQAGKRLQGTDAGIAIFTVTSNMEASRRLGEENDDRQRGDWEDAGDADDEQESDDQQRGDWKDQSSSDGVSANNAKAKMNAKIMRGATTIRRLEDGHADQEVDLTGYSLKFETCGLVNQYKAEGDDEFSLSSPPVFFRLCPGSSCGNCDENYGEYVVDMETYLEATLEYKQEQQEKNCAICEQCQHEEANAHDDTGDNGDEDEDADMCKGIDTSTCNKCNFLEEMEGIDASELVGCSKHNMTAEGGDSFYAGAYCASSGTEIKMGMFSDEKCSVRLNSEIENDTQLKHSYHLLKETFATGECIANCLQEDEDQNNDNDGDGNNNDNYQQGKTAKVCKDLYGPAGKCERTAINKNGEEEAGGCDFITAMKPVKLERIVRVATPP